MKEMYERKQRRETYFDIWKTITYFRRSNKKKPKSRKKWNNYIKKETRTKDLFQYLAKQLGTTFSIPIRKSQKVKNKWKL